MILNYAKDWIECKYNLNQAQMVWLNKLYYNIPKGHNFSPKQRHFLILCHGLVAEIVMPINLVYNANVTNVKSFNTTCSLVLLMTMENINT